MTSTRSTPTGWSAGVGSADITGEAAECGMLGYGMAHQQTAGIHTRLRSRAFVLADADGRRVLLVVNEMPLPLESITQEVLRRLARVHGDLYTEANVMVTATHTHCGPGGYAHHLTYNGTTGGFREDTFAAIVDGTVEAVARAHDDVSPATLGLAHGTLHGASVNRSRSSFDLNPEADRAFFPDAIDPQTTLLRIDKGGRTAGVVNWFATHGTSMSNRNRLIGGDNKGYAALHWERHVEGVDHLDPADGDLVAAFAQTNAGDMSPNLHLAPGSGPTDDEVENTRIIGRRQYDAAAGLLGAAADPLGAGLDHRLTYVDLGDVLVRPEFTGDGRPHRTGRAVASAAQFAGTDEGPGFGGFRQGRNPLWDAVSRRLVYPLAPRLRDAHAPKAVVLPAWLVNRAYPMVQERVPVQLLRLGRLHLIGIPGEVTIVAGLRLRRTVAEILDVDLADVLVAGYSNAYVHYVTTPEEYEAQRYEAGSTMFGRWELGAFQQTVASLAVAMRDGEPVPSGPRPADLSRRRLRWARRPGTDEPLGAFGAVLRPPPASVSAGTTVSAELCGAHPNHDLRRGGTYVEVQRETAGGWQRIADDQDWSTRFAWRREGRAASVVTVSWDVPADAEPGRHRLVHHGAARTADGRLVAFTGATDPFEVRAGD